MNNGVTYLRRYIGFFTACFIMLCLTGCVALVPFEDYLHTDNHRISALETRVAELETAVESLAVNVTPPPNGEIPILSVQFNLDQGNLITEKFEITHVLWDKSYTNFLAHTNLLDQRYTVEMFLTNSGEVELVDLRESVTNTITGGIWQEIPELKVKELDPTLANPEDIVLGSVEYTKYTRISIDNTSDLTLSLALDAIKDNDQHGGKLSFAQRILLSKPGPSGTEYTLILLKDVNDDSSGGVCQAISTQVCDNFWCRTIRVLLCN